MESSTAPCLVLPNAENYCNYLSTGYLEDALIEFSVRFKRRKLSSCSSNDHYYDDNHHDPVPTHITDDLSYWNNWLTNFSLNSNNNHEEELSHTRLLTDHDMSELSRTIASSSDASSFMNKSNDHFVYASDTYSTDSSSIYGDMELHKKNKMTTKCSKPRKMVYPFGLVKPGAEDGDITLNDINRRLSMPPTRPIKHPVGDFACRSIMSSHGLGLSGKAVVALTKIQTQGRGTITIIRTKG